MTASGLRMTARVLSRFVRSLPAWFGELVYSLGPDLILLGLFSLLLAVMTFVYGAHLSILHASTLMPLGAMLVLVLVSLVGRLRASRHGHQAARDRFARSAWVTVRDWF